MSAQAERLYALKIGYADLLERTYLPDYARRVDLAESKLRGWAAYIIAWGC